MTRPLDRAAAARRGEKLLHGDIVVVAQKIVSKAEGRLVKLSEVQPGERAQELAHHRQRSARRPGDLDDSRRDTGAARAARGGAEGG